MLSFAHITYLLYTNVLLLANRFVCLKPIFYCDISTNLLEHIRKLLIFVHFINGNHFAYFVIANVHLSII